MSRAAGEMGLDRGAFPLFALHMAGSEHPYCVAPVAGPHGGLEDLACTVDGKVRRLWGRAGAERERRLAQSCPEGALPVLLGSGLGPGLDLLAARGPVAVVDREAPILELTGLRQRFADRPDVLWLDGDAPQCLDALAAWRDEHGGRPLHPLAMPLYLRLDPEHYRGLSRALAQPQGRDFWQRVRYPKFRSRTPRVLLLERDYFLYPEVRSAMRRLGFAHRGVGVGPGDRVRRGFVEDFLAAVMEFRPDMVLTVNHMGLDREGRFTELLERLGLPLASWFVDSPRLVLHDYAGLAGPLTVIFTWDAASVAPLRAAGYQATFHLPLATDPDVFRPDAPAPAEARGQLPARVSFVGSSMVRRMRQARAGAAPGPALSAALKAAALGLPRRADADVPALLREEFPEAHREYLGLASAEQRLALETLVTWEATRRYRTACVERLLPCGPVIAGDRHWADILGRGAYTLLPPLDYYADLPGLYARSQVNFNCTSVQMPGGVNQRVFDVPAAGGFLLTDKPDVMAPLFEPGRECACFRDPDEIPALVERYLEDAEARGRIAAAARRRVLAEHTYDHRLRTIADTVRDCVA